MDRSNLVDSVTRSVSAALQGAGTPLRPRRTWVLYTEDTKAFADALAGLRRTPDELAVVLPRWAQGTLPAQRLAGVRTINEADLKDVARAVADVELAVLSSVPPALERQLRAKRPEAFTARVVRALLDANRPVFVLGSASAALQALGIGGMELEAFTGGKAPDLKAESLSVSELVAMGVARVGMAPGISPADHQLARMIDHTLLKAEATQAEVDKLCKEAAKYHFASVCVNPANVAQAAGLLKGTDVKVCTVVGFPLGATPCEVKAFETGKAIADGATEIDMVINVGALKSKQYAVVERDIRAVVEACPPGIIHKVIIEASLLTDEEKVTACALAKAAGAHFVKTSTGFSTGGATAHDIALMRATVGPGLGVKASGGVRDRATALAMVRAGATRIGASASVAIVSGKSASSSGY